MPDIIVKLSTTNPRHVLFRNGFRALGITVGMRRSFQLKFYYIQNTENKKIM